MACEFCPRLKAWREEVARRPPRRFADDRYHARPVPGFGDPRARLLIVGLAPAAHGANRTGRMFTGDRSGEWLYRALHRAGFANCPISIGAGDGLKLREAYVTAVCRCAPPDNRPTPEEIATCRQWLVAELDWHWPRLRVIVTLGALALQGTLAAIAERGISLGGGRPRFRHGARVRLGEEGPWLLASYHPSQQNTFTGKLTESMFDEVWREARRLVDSRD